MQGVSSKKSSASARGKQQSFSLETTDTHTNLHATHIQYPVGPEN